MPRFLHVADLHLDSPRGGLSRDAGAPASEIQQAPRKALERLVEAAIAQQVAAVVIAGDLYDGDWKDHQTGLFFVRQAQKLADAGIPVVLIAGNHDAQSVITQQLPLPANVTTLSVDTPQTFTLEDRGLALHGQGFKNRFVQNNLAAGYPDRIGGLVNVGLLHTSLTGFEGHEVYAPCGIDDLSRKGYDYWALGHIHKRQEFALAGGGVAVFPGNLQGRHIRETGPKGCEIIEYDGTGIVSRRSLVLDVFRWELLTVDLAEARTWDEVLSRIEERLASFRQTCDPLPHALRLELTGTTPCHGRLIDRERDLRAEVQSLVVQLGSGQWWLEDVSLRTRLPSLPASSSGEGDSIGGELLDLARSLGSGVGETDSLQVRLKETWDDLRKKLPPEIPLTDVLTDPQSTLAIAVTTSSQVDAAQDVVANAAAWESLGDEALALLSSRLGSLHDSPTDQGTRP
jgi:DNA repair exonuclease SbcCD nuclease subunit